MNLRTVTLVSLLTALVGVRAARTDSCTYSLNWRSDITSADHTIMAHACASGWIPHWWAEYGFASNASYWDDGFGSDNWCNEDKPLGRTMNALYLLKFSFSPPNDWGDLSGNFIQWGYPYAGAQFVDANDMEAFCGDFSGGKPIQYASTHDSWPEDHFEWFMGFFYLENPVERASSLFHESIHRGTGKSHDCQDGGADTSWAFHGAYYYGVEWLISYYLHANTNTNSSYKTWAAQNANSRIGNKFCAGDVPASVKNWAGASAGSSFNGTFMSNL
jgi:hypothetical protein